PPARGGIRGRADVPDPVDDRQLDHEAGPLADRRLDPEPAAVGLDEAPGDRQAEARAGVAVAALAAVEGLEDPLLLGRADPRALVDDADRGVVAGRPGPHPDRSVAAVAGGVL